MQLAKLIEIKNWIAESKYGTQSTEPNRRPWPRYFYLISYVRFNESRDSGMFHRLNFIYPVMSALSRNTVLKSKSGKK